MAFMRLGSKSDAFHREGQTWLCTTGLVSDVTIEVGDMKFHLHKFPLLSRSGLLEKLIQEESSNDDGSSSNCVLTLDEIPGGGKTFELITKFCYGVKIELTAFNVVSLRCAAEYLEMTDNYGEKNLIGISETFLNEVFSNWTDSIKALQTCEEVIEFAEDLNIISRCVDSLALKACADPSLFNWPKIEDDNNNNNNNNSHLWNGISPSGKMMLQPTGEDWWFDDTSFLSLPLFKRLIIAIESRGMKLENIAMALMYYTKKHISMMNKQVTMDDHQVIETPNPSEAVQKLVLEEIVELLPSKKGVNPTKFLLRLLQTAMVLQASQSSRENLERRIGNQLDQAALVDLLIPNMGYSETLYDVECVLRMIEQFVSSNEQASMMVPSPCIVEEGGCVKDDDLVITPLTLVATLVDGYLAEVAPDANLKLSKFEAIASAIPDYARPLDDGVYHAIDVYLKAHAWITDSEREQMCRLMNCQKLSLEASTHAAQNERLPLRVIVQVLFFEQLRLRTSVSSWLYVSENLDNPENQIGGNVSLLKPSGENMRERVSELEKDCMNMKQELQKLVRSKRSWKNFTRKLNFKKKTECCKPKDQAKAAI